MHKNKSPVKVAACATGMSRIKVLFRYRKLIRIADGVDATLS
jgi:hypothetical protein